MSRTKKITSLIVLLLLSVTLIAPVSQVFAAQKVDETVKGHLAEQVAAFLEGAYTATDEELDTLREAGGFYEVFVRSWYEDRKVTGDFKEVVSTEAEDPKNGQVAVNCVVDFEDYTSDVILYFDENELSPVNYVMNIRYSMGEKMKQAAQNMAVGLIVVFAILIFLMFIISLFRFIGPKEKKAAAASDKAAEAVVPAAAAEAVSQEAASAAGAEEEIAAVIAAAIAAASEEAPSASGYVVRSVKRGNRSVWKRV